jgi:hypothetical protein
MEGYSLRAANSPDSRPATASSSRSTSPRATSQRSPISLHGGGEGGRGWGPAGIEEGRAVRAPCPSASLQPRPWAPASPGLLLPREQTHRTSAWGWSVMAVRWSTTKNSRLTFGGGWPGGVGVRWAEVGTGRGPGRPPPRLDSKGLRRPLQTAPQPAGGLLLPPPPSSRPHLLERLEQRQQHGALLDALHRVGGHPGGQRDQRQAGCAWLLGPLLRARALASAQAGRGAGPARATTPPHHHTTTPPHHHTTTPPHHHTTTPPHHSTAAAPPPGPPPAHRLLKNTCTEGYSPGAREKSATRRPTLAGEGVMK